MQSLHYFSQTSPYFSATKMYHVGKHLIVSYGITDISVKNKEHLERIAELEGKLLPKYAMIILLTDQLLKIKIKLLLLKIKMFVTAYLMLM